jgi:predicted DNA-binding WGR domain protein
LLPASPGTDWERPGLGEIRGTGTRSPVQHALVPHKVKPDRGVARFYSLMVERDLFGTIRLVRNWGRIGTNGRELAEEFATEIEAEAVLEALARAKRRRGYGDL